MGAGRVVGGAARTTGRGARMARRMFRRKGGKDAPKNPRHENPDISSYFGGGEARVRPSSALVPFAAGASVDASTSTSTSSGGDDVEEIAIRIKTNLISVEKLLKDSAAYRENIREQERRKKEKQEADDAEKNLEKDKPKQKNKFKLPVPREIKSFWGNVKDFLMKVFLAQFMDQILNMRGPLINVLKVLAKVADVALNIIGWIFNVVVTIVDAAFKLVEGMRGLVKNIFGEKGLEVFDSFLSTMVKVINLVGSVGMVFAALGGVGMVTKLMAWLKGGAAIKAAGLAGGAGGVGGTGGAAGAAGMGGAAAAGVVAGAGLLASGLGEGMGQLNKWGLEREKNWKKKAKDKWWTDPRKYFWAAAAGIMTVLNRFFGFIGAIFDIIGAPFRMIIELIRFPFLDEEGKKKQAENLAKFDARIREQLRQGLNAIDFLGLISDDKGSWGSLYGEKGTDGMGYTKDGKLQKGSDTGSTGGKMTPFDYLKEQGLEVRDLEDGMERFVHVYNPKLQDEDGNYQGTKISGTYPGKDELSTEEFINTNFTIKKLKQIANDTKPQGIMRGITGALDFVTGGMFDFDQRNREGAPKDWGIRRIAGGLADAATLGITDFDKRGAGLMQLDPMFGGKDKAWGAADEQAKRGEAQSGFGLKRGIGGLLDFATLGMFDFDKQNRKGAPKDYGIRRIAGGVADWATLGITDFDKRGAGVMQVDPMFGGKDKAWGSRNEQAKRREKQSGFGLKRGIGGALDFATLGMFDFDKQNRRGAPKGFGIKRIVGGLADVLTGGTTDFDKRGSGFLQYGGFTGRRMKRPEHPYQDRIDELRFSEKGLKIGGERYIPGQALSERQYNAVNFARKASNVKYNDEVLRSYAMYEEQNASAAPEVIVINKNTTVPVKVGGTEVMMVGSGSDGGSSDESYASYQGH